ncbi:MAG: PIN domain-containing protein [Thermoproteota archaeon]
MSVERGSKTFAGHVLDTYAWVDYLAGDGGANKVAELLDNPHGKLVTPATAVAELTERLLREGIDKSKIQQVIKFIGSKSEIYPCDEEVAFRAGELNFAQKKKAKDWGMLDSLNYAVANVLRCRFVTGDPHFRDFKRDVVFLR